jgi:hypothetical protein
MKKTALALSLAALVAAAANPALACGSTYGKSYRAAQAATKPAVAKKAEPSAPAGAAFSTTEGLQTTASATGLAPASTEL